MAGVMKSVNRAVVLGDGLNGWCGEGDGRRHALHESRKGW